MERVEENEEPLKMLPQSKYYNTVGRIWNKVWIRPYESLWCVWQRYKHVNVLTDTDVLLELRVKPAVINQKRGLFFHSGYAIYTKIGALSSASLLDFFNIPTDHFESFRLLFTLEKSQYESMHNLIHHNLVYCPVCLKKVGFHSYIHQIAGLPVCPWHPEQRMIHSDALMYEIAKDSTYAYGNRFFLNIEQPLPVFSINNQPISKLIIPYGKLYVLFKSRPKSNLLPYLTGIQKDYIRIGKAGEEMDRRFFDLAKYLARVFYDHINDSGVMSSFESFLSFVLESAEDTVFFTSLAMYAWQCEIMKQYSQVQINKYIHVMDYEGCSSKEKLPDGNLVAIMRCMRALTGTESYQSTRSTSWVYNKSCRIVEENIKADSLEFRSYIQASLLNISKRANGIEQINQWVCCVFYAVMMDYLEYVLPQIEADPYAPDLSGVVEPNYMLVCLEDAEWGFYRII